MMMKILVFVCCVAAVVVARPDEKYTDKYDNINLQEILDNDRLLDSYLNCLLEKGKCTPEGKELKEHLQEAIETGCAKCTEAQEKGAKTTIAFLIDNKIEIWKKIADKYDPDGKYRKKYEDFAREKGIQIPE